MSAVIAFSAAQSALAVRIDWEKDPKVSVDHQVDKSALRKAAFMGRRIGWVSKIISCDKPETRMLVSEGQVEAELSCDSGGSEPLAVARFAFPDLRYDEGEKKIFGDDEVIAVSGGAPGEFSLVESFVLKSKVVPVSIDNRPAGVLIFVSIRRVVKDETQAPFPGTQTP